MSASPADRTAGRTPNGGPGNGQVMRRPRIADPLVRPKKRPTQRPSKLDSHVNQAAEQNKGVHKVNGIKPVPGPAQAVPQQPSHRPIVMSSASETSVSGFSSRPLAPYTDFPLVMSKKALMEGYRHHVARFSSKRSIDPRDSQEFVRPVRLHRRDPRAPPSGAGIKSEDTLMSGMEGLEDKEQEKQEILRAERDAAKAAEQALVAPGVNSSGQRRLGNNMKKTEFIYRNDQTDEQKARSKLRYEESLPWYLEDFDNKSTWVGAYEAALSMTYGMMIQGQDGTFRMTPLEKWYKFKEKDKFRAPTIEEAESHYAKKVKEPRWFMVSEESRKKREEQEGKVKPPGRALFLGYRENDGGGSGVAKPAVKHESADADDLDFQEDRFADDEENMGNLFDEDEETKEAEERIKRDQLQANIFDLKAEKEYEKQEELERKEKDAQKKLGKKVKRALKKHEKNLLYDSDGSDNPYTSSASESDAESARQNEAEQSKAEQDRKNLPDGKSSLLKSKAPSSLSGSSAKGNGTPSHRQSKHPSPSPASGIPRSASSTSLKRPGSPLASDASGNESSIARKKAKKSKNSLSASQPPPSNLGPQPPSRPTSPPIPSSSAPNLQQHSRPSSLAGSIKRSHAAGSGSDSEGAGTAASGGEMSDGTRKRIKLRLGQPKLPGETSPNGTPVSGSRASSPDVPMVQEARSAPTSNTVSNGVPSATGASAGASGGGSAGRSTSDELPFPTAEQVRALIPPEGIRSGDLLKHFTGRLKTPEQKDRFIKLMKANTRFDKDSRMLFPPL